MIRLKTTKQNHPNPIKDRGHRFSRKQQTKNIISSPE